MQTPETAAWSTCHHCGQAVAVKKNKGGLAYYRCDHCGVKHEHTWQKNSGAWLQSIGVAPEPKAAPATPPEPKPAPAKPARAPATFFS